MKNVITFLALFTALIIGAQEADKPQIEINKEAITNMMTWYLDITEKGIERIGDSVKYGKEFIKLLNDDAYRKSIFPERYTWELTVPFLQRQELKQSFWYFINLYPQNKTNKELVIKAVLAYDKVFKMDEMLVNAFYTYSFMDPEISIIKDGKPEIVRPDILEAKLANVKEMVTYVIKNREQQKKEKN